MAIDWDADILGPVMSIFGEGLADDPSSWPVFRASCASTAVPIPGAVFDAQYQRVTDLGDGTTESAYHPVLGVRDAVFASLGIVAKKGALIFIPSADQLFAIKDVQSDGHGHTLLILIEAQ